MGEDRLPAGGTAEVVPPPQPSVNPYRDEDIYGPASFPASDPPSTWAGA